MMSSDSLYIKSISEQFADGLFSTTEHFCLVPEALYQTENNDLWLNFGKETIADTQQIAVAYIPTQACYLLWEKDDKAQHIISALVGCDCVDGVLCALSNKQIIIVLFLKGKLQMANIYPITTQEDILYHLLNIYTQWQLDANTLHTLLIGASAETKAFINQYISCEMKDKG